MTIRSKLTWLVVGLIAAFGLSIGAYFAILSPIGKIEAEQGVLGSLRDAMIDREIKANLILTADSFASVAAEDAASRQRLADAFAATSGLKTLPAINGAIHDSLVAIGNLKLLLDGYESSVADAVDTVASALAKEPGGAAQQLFRKFGAQSFASIDASVFRFEVFTLVNDISSLTVGLTTSATVIDQQNAEIAKEIALVEDRSTLIALAAVIAVMVVALVLTLRSTGKISGAIRSIQSGIGALKDGDLMREFPVLDSDEIGALSADLGSFVSGLRHSIAHIQAASAENIAMKESLLGTVEEASSSANQIAASNESMVDRMASLDGSLGEATGAVEGIAMSIADLDGRIREQMSMVEESTASVTQMIASIESVTKIADQRRDATDGLVQTVSAGGEKMSATFDVITKIAESVDSIEDITQIIAGISSQTNLLAMNAAIEAAHAGDAGKGFSVVADEIRKLAEASSQNSKEIGAILEEIVGRIDEATRSGKETNAAFKEVEADVRVLRASLEEIFSNMRELRTGGEQILQAMTILREVSVRVNDGSASISGNAADIRQSMATLKRISAEVTGGMTEISAGIRSISVSEGGVLSNAERLGLLGESLNIELSGFKTE
jgi:methyl-accepting chemotaxis protein